MSNAMPSDSFAIVISAPGIDQPTRQQAELSQLLVNAKIDHQCEVVSQRRARHARERLLPGMRVFFHQGGAPSRWAPEFPNAGRLVAQGYYFSLNPLGLGDPPPDVPIELWRVERAIFADLDLTHIVRYRNVKRIREQSQPLTGSIVGRPPLPWENYIVVPLNHLGHEQLSRLWSECCSL